MSDMRNRTIIDKYSLALHISVLFFGVSGLFGQLISSSSLNIVTGRVFFAMLSLFVLRKVFKLSYQNLSKRHYLLMILSGIVLTSHWFSFFYAIKKAGVSAGLFMFASFPVFSLVLEKLIYRNKLCYVELISIMLCVSGLFIISNHLVLQNLSSLTLFLGIYSGLSFAILGLLNKRLLETIDVFTVNFYQYSVSFLLLTPYLVKNYQEFLNFSVLLLLALLGIVFTMLSHSMFIFSLKKISLFKASIVASLEPVYGSIAAIIFLNESFYLKILVGGLLILSSGLFLNIKNDKPVNSDLIL